ncbi:replication initiator 1 [Pectinophora gossypiella]|nr:replication initiator 1 [Pectinophora gossypiella]
MCCIAEAHKESQLPSALLSLLQAQAQAQSLTALVPARLPPRLPCLPDTVKAHLLQQAFLQNNNAPAKQDDHESDAEYDDTDDIVLPDEGDAFYDANSAYSLDATGSVDSNDAFDTKSEAKSQYKRDGNSSDDASRQFECRHCGKKYRWKSTLRRHENVECGGKAPAHQCPYCAYRAKQRGNLGVHIRKHHNTEWYIYANNKVRRNKKTCNYYWGGPGCVPEDVSFSRIGGLSWEQWSARLALPLVACGAGLRPAHAPAPGEPGFACPDCGRLYKLKSSLRNHQKWECGKEPQFQCPYCVYRAKQKMHIARHMERMHREVHMKPEHYVKQDNIDACT